MALSLDLDRAAGLSLYHQIAEQIKTQICDGRLPARAQLPTVRQLAEDLGVTRLTVQNAYGELQSGGWIEATVGRGTFVSDAAQPFAFMTNMMSDMTTNGHHPLTPDSVIDDILQMNQVRGMRSMASASPDPTLFPADEFWAALMSLKDDLLSMIAYGSPQGDPMLRVEMAAALREQGIAVVPDEIIITSGVTQGLSLVTQVLARAGDTVLVEQPTYLGLLNILKTQQLRPIGVPLDGDGPQLDALERTVIQHRPRFFYTVPNFQNPTGLCASLERRHQILEMAQRYGFLVIEDDIYGRLAYDHPVPATMKSMDRSGSVIFLTGESKVLMPSLRVGTVVAPSPVHERILALRRATDLCGPTILQRAHAAFLRDKGLKRHLRRVLPVYKRRRDTLLLALEHYMPETVQWTRPAGGFCCWLTLPRHHALRDLHRDAMQRGLALTPGEVFLAQPSTHVHLRLAFGGQTREAIHTSVELLSQLIRQRLAQENHREDELFDWTPLV